jgi:hypothetical protein
MRRHVDAEPPRPRTLVPDLPPAVDDAITRALAKDPLDRFDTAEDLVRALDQRAPAAALVPRAPAGVARRACVRCGGWVVDAAATCADCGARMLRLERARRGGVDVIVTGPGKLADRIDAQKHVALYKLLDELPPGTMPVRRGRRRAPRFPFYVARRITRASASALVERLQAAGLEAQVDAGTWDARSSVVGKVWLLGGRYVMGFSLLSTASLWIHLIPRGWGLWSLLLIPCVPATIMIGASLALTRGNLGPLVPGRSRLAPSSDLLRPLAAGLSRLASRQDRRLVGQILERLGRVEAAGQAQAVAPVAARAARVAEALAALDARRDHDAAAPADAAGALAALRGEERTRVVLRADLLRAASRLHDFSLALARAGATSAADQTAHLDQEVADLALAVDVEEEISSLLEGPR